MTRNETKKKEKTLNNKINSEIERTTKRTENWFKRTKHKNWKDEDSSFTDTNLRGCGVTPETKKKTYDWSFFVYPYFI